jgi:hypothetical protein
MSYKNTVDLFRGLLSDIEDDDAKALRLGLQPPVMAQQQVPQVQIPMAPPAPQQPIPEIEIPQPLVGSMVNRGSARAGDADRMQQAQQAQRIEDYGVPFDPASIPTGSFGRVYDSGLPPSSGFPTIPGGTGEKAPVYQDAGEYMRNWKKNNQAELDFIENNPEEVKKRETIVLKSPPPGFIKKAVDAEGSQEVKEEPSIFDNMRAPRPSYLVPGFEEAVSSQETLDKTYEFGNWVKDNPAEAAAAGVSLVPAARLGSLATSGGAKVVSKLSNFSRNKLPKRFRDFFGNTKTVTSKSNTSVQRPGQPGVYDPLKTTKEVFTVSPIKTGVTAAALYGGSEAGEALFPDIPEPEGSGIPKAEQELLDGEPEVDLTTTQPAVTTTQPADEGGSNLTQQDAKEAKAVITDTVKTDADALFKDAGTAPKKDAPPEEKEGFLKKLWGGMKDMFKEGMEDPAFRKTLFAYVGSKALGYDGVTFAGQVLENEWKVQAAERKQEFELEKIYGKEGLATIKAEKKAKTIDPSKVATIYDKETETNLTGAFSADGTMVRLDNAGFYESLGIEPDENGVYPVLPVANVRAAQGGKRFSVGVGLTGNDIISGIRANIDLDVDNAIKTYVSNQGLESSEAEQLTAKLNDAINGTVRNGAARAFKSFYPAGTDFSDFNLQEVSTNAVQKYIQSVAMGMEGNSKNLAAFMEKERLKIETEYSVSPSFFKVVGDDSEDAIGGEVWSKATAKVKYLASAFGKEIGANKAVPKVAMWSNLERLYNKQSEEMGPDFKKFWESESEDSADKKGQGASPALLWVMSMDRDKSATSSKYFAGSMQDVITKMK